MKSFLSLFAAAVMGVTLTAPVLAAPNPDAPSIPPRSGAVTPGDALSPPNDHPDDGPSVVTGRVLKVDAQEGTLVIQTPIGVIALRGPSEDLRELSVGDVVQVQMVRDDDDTPSASPSMEPSEKQ
jgi:hypothetical protein